MGKAKKTAADPFALIDADVRRKLNLDAELDVIVQPIIDARVHAFLGLAADGANIPSYLYADARTVSEVELTRRAREGKTANRRRLIRQYLHPALKKIVAAIPAVGVNEIRAGVKDLMPSQGAHRPQIPFDPVLVRQAHESIQKARGWDCRAACQALAERLHVSRKTIEDLRRRRSS